MPPFRLGTLSMAMSAATSSADCRATPADILRELVQNEYDAGGTELRIEFGQDALVVSGNEMPINKAGWDRLGVMLGHGLVAGPRPCQPLDHHCRKPPVSLLRPVLKPHIGGVQWLSAEHDVPAASQGQAGGICRMRGLMLGWLTRLCARLPEAVRGSAGCDSRCWGHS